MIVTVEVDNKTKIGKSLITLLKHLAKTSEGIQFIEEDNELLGKMKRSLKSGRSGKKELKQTLHALLAK